MLGAVGLVTVAAVMAVQDTEAALITTHARATAARRAADASSDALADQHRMHAAALKVRALAAPRTGGSPDRTAGISRPCGVHWRCALHYVEELHRYPGNQWLGNPEMWLCIAASIECAWRLECTSEFCVLNAAKQLQIYL